MKVIHLGAISTGMVVLLGVIVVVPAFTQKNAPPQLATILLFSVAEGNGEGLPAWCQDLAGVLEKHGVKATVFVAGHTADAHPGCVSIFSRNGNIDIGSQTYGYVDLASVTDYSLALDEVRKGKQAVDKAGNVDSRLFQAPYGSVDGNIYSMLSRSGISADFSYPDHYNKYYDGEFIRYNISSYDGSKHPASFFSGLGSAGRPLSPIVITFDSSVPVPQIDAFLAELQSARPDNYDFQFVNASDLAGTTLTDRKESP